MFSGSQISFNEMELTKEVAKYKLNNEMSSKEFWPVVGKDYSNLYSLQAILDVLFNKQDENYRIYVGIIQRSQNITRLNIQCKVCNTDLSSYDPFMTHDKGRQHKKALQQYLYKDTANPNISSIPVFRSWNESNGCFAFLEGSLEYKLSKTAHHVLGYQFVYKYKGEETYFCHLCSHQKSPPQKMNKDDAFNHIIGDRHILKFLKVKYNRKYDSYEVASTDRDFEDIVKTEGKITSTLLEIECPSNTGRYPEKLRICNSTKLTKDACQQGTQTEVKSESVETFMNELLKLKNSLSTNKGLVNALKNDPEAYDLIIVLLKILAHKFYTYSDNNENPFMDSAKKLWEKTNALKIPPTSVDWEVD